MAKRDSEAAVAFATQSAEGVYNPTLDAIAASLTTANGLLRGVADRGADGAGLDLALIRDAIEAAVIAGSFTRPLSTKRRVAVGSFTFATPFVGNKAAASTPPNDGNAVPTPGLGALLTGLGMVGAAWGAGVGQVWTFGSTNPISALVYADGLRLECLDCRCTGTIEFEAGGTGILEVTVAVGSIKDVAEAALPGTLDYSPQEDVSDPIVEAVGFTWRDARGFQSLELAIDNTIDDVPDSNAPAGSGGVAKEQSNRVVTLSATLYKDDSTDDRFDYDQLDADLIATLEPLTFQVGPAMTDGDPVLGVRIDAPSPELQESTREPLGSKAGTQVEAILKGQTANSELELIFL